MIAVNASQRLASATQVEAVTNAKGAVKFLRSEFSKHDLGIKKVTQESDASLSAVFKGPFGPITVGITLGKGGRVQFAFTDASGLVPKANIKGMGADSVAVTLKMGKGGENALSKPIDALAKFQGTVEKYAQDLGESHAWLISFQDALYEIEGQMDKGKRG
jgi:hypothetical protein